DEDIVARLTESQQVKLDTARAASDPDVRNFALAAAAREAIREWAAARVQCPDHWQAELERDLNAASPAGAWMTFSDAIDFLDEPAEAGAGTGAVPAAQQGPVAVPPPSAGTASPTGAPAATPRGGHEPGARLPGRLAEIDMGPQSRRILQMAVEAGL